MNKMGFKISSVVAARIFWIAPKFDIFGVLTTFDENVLYDKNKII